MEPRIQYAQTADGVSIAFSTLGEGKPLVHMPYGMFSHLQLGWLQPEQRRWFESLAEKKTLIRYDHRGSGLSERNVTDLSLDALVVDLEAVVDSLGLQDFALFGVFRSGPVAIAYAVRHPERVSHLLLMNTYARGSDFPRSPRYQAIWRLIDTDWELFTETFAQETLGWSAGEEARRIAALVRESVTPETFLAFEALRQADVSYLLSQVRTPTLVLHQRQAPLDVKSGSSLASQIAGARLVIVEGEFNVPFRGDIDAALRAIDEFLGEGDEPTAEPPAAGDVHTILFTDMESSTALTQRLGDAKAQELLRTHNTIVRDALKASGGSEVKHTGDGIMASFPSASGALECAIAIQRAVAERHAEPVEASLRVRIGLNAGEPVAEEEDLFGTAVQLAARICDRAEAGEILASNVVRELAAGKGFLFSDRGETALRGFEDPLRLYEVRWRESAGGG